ncbi:TIGR01777 family oxidoreductase [Agaribacterium haliotis]|uniref:TIGR01777 family oxidoreductase n=1 Tax=Agaribacterium haliotis TaxID=2013869 RepID=UPI000BB55B22|nr:TIGR01777 family oxidoreductase [Agaribacterium haliotis]
MRILITGGTGLIARHFIAAYPDYHYCIYTRNTALRSSETLAYIHSLDQLANLNDFDAVINLAGEPIADKRWTQKQKNKLRHSRLHTTEKIVELMQRSDKAPLVFLSGSAIGYYGSGLNSAVDENYGQIQADFAHELCRDWEAAALNAQASCRVVCLRTAVVLAENGGALKKMLLPFKLGLGGPIASGKQFMSWIHIHDMVRAMHFLLCESTLSGPVNMAAPQSLPNAEFCKALAKRLKRPALMPMPAALLKILMGEASSLLLESQQVLPTKLQKAGFNFSYAELDKALQALKL